VTKPASSTAWSHLPNAEHIDRVIASAKVHPEVWEADWGISRDMIEREAMQAVRKAERFDTLRAVWLAILDVDRVAVWLAVRGSILALTAYDDAGKYLEMSSYELKIWAALSEDPYIILISPAVIAFEKEKIENAYL